jgi:UDP-2-acetamido-2-deoxy-ribo-hexuluronate aminotransferase
MQFIDLKTQYERYQDEIVARMNAVFAHGRYIMGPEIVELEEELAKYVGVNHCITVASGTASLEIALRALEIGPGDEVTTVPFTWISTAEVIGLVGAKPVFVDIEPKTFNMDIDLLEGAITERTKAIIPVSLFGQMPDYSRINQIAAKHKLPVIEDGAQSFGATQNGSKSCGVTLLGSTSFFPAKPLGCYGDGGAVFTDDDQLAETVRAIRDHGGERHHHKIIGTNGRFDTLQAAALLAKFPHFDWEVQQRAKIGARYSTKLYEHCTIPELASGNTHVYGQYTIRVSNRDTVVSKMKEQETPTAIYYPKCLHEQPVFADLGYELGDFPEAEKASQEVMSLPMHPFLSEEDQDDIIKKLTIAIADC